MTTATLVEPKPTHPDSLTPKTTLVEATPAATTHHTPPRRGRRRTPVPVPGQARVVVWTVAVATLGMLVLLTGATWALAAAGDIRISEGIAKETGEIQRFAAFGVDPATGSGFTTARRFIEVHLEAQQPDRNELFIGSLPGTGVVLERRGDRTVTSGILDPAVQAAMASPGAGSIRTTDHGRISWQTVTIDAADWTGLITVVRFHTPHRQEMSAQIGVLTLVALISLGATGFTAWWVAGRLRPPTRLFEEADRHAHPRQRAMIGSQLDEVTRVQNLVNDLTMLQRIELPGLIEPDLGIVMAEFLDILVDVWQTRVTEVGAPDVTVWRGVCEPNIVATFDEPRLARAVDELVANAVQASEPGSAVWLSASTDARGGWVHLDVIGRGRGIPAAETTSVFDPFVTASNDPRPGVGLGLTVAHRLVVAMAGTLTLIAHEDSPGLTARITLPVTGP